MLLRRLFGCSYFIVYCCSNCVKTLCVWALVLWRVHLAGEEIAGCFTLNNEPVHGISNNVLCATSKASDQPAHTRSLLRAFACRLSIL